MRTPEALEGMMNFLIRCSKRVREGSRRALVLTLCLFLAAGPALAAVPQNVVYQGSLRQSGSPFTGSATMIFRITDATGATQYWTSGAGGVSVPVTGSFFRYSLGTPNQASFQAIDWSSITPYVEVTVNGQLLLPREQLNAVPYAILAGSLPYVSPGAAGVDVTNNLFVTGNVGLSAGQTVTLGRAPVSASEAATKAYVDAEFGVGGGGILASTNTWSAWQTHLNQVTFSTDVYFPAGQINVRGKRVTTPAGNLDAAQLANIVPLTSLSGITNTELASGLFPNITGVGTMTGGTWQANTIGMTYGGTGASLVPAAGAIAYSNASNLALTAAGVAGQVLQSNGAGTPTWANASALNVSQSNNLAGGAAGAVPYQSAVNTTAMLPAGTGGQVLQSNGAAAPSWTSSVAQAANVAGGLIGTLPYQSAANTTAMLPAGTAGQILLSNGSAAPSWSGSANITGVGTVTAGTWNASTIASGWGGTGANLSAGAQGGVPYFSGIGVMGAIGAGAGGSILQSGGAGAPSWLAPTSFLAGTATNIAGGLIGSVPYQTAANTTALLPAGTAGQVLQSNGAAAPSWASAFGTAINLGGGALGDIPYQTGPNTTTFLLPGPVGNLLMSNGVAAPSWLADGTAGQILLANGVAAPSWTNDFSAAMTFSGGYGSVAGAANSLAIGAGGGAPNAVSIKFGDGSGWKYHIGTNIGAVFTPRMTVVDSGNVGIGTTGPGQKLTVSPNSAMSFALGGLPNTVAGIGAYGANPADGLGLFVHDTTSGYIGWVGALRNGNENCAGWGCKTLRLQVPDGSGNVLNAVNIQGVNGYVGIGTTSPGSKLQLYDAAASDYLTITAPLANQSAISFGDITNGQDSVIYRPGSTRDLHMYTATAGDVLNITQAGSVGIGTTAPGFKLEVVAANASWAARIGNTNATNAYAYFEDAAGYGMHLRNDNANSGTYLLDVYNGTLAGPDALYVRGDGHIGIGTNNPTDKLTIGGVAGVDGIRFPDGSFMNSASIGTANGISTPADVIINSDSDSNGSGDIIFQTKSTERGRIVNGGQFQVNNGLNVNQDNNNGGSVNPGITFGVNGSGEGISSKRNAGGNQNGLDFYTSSGNRMSITNGGSVGIGTTGPGWLLDVNGDTHTNGWFRTSGNTGWFSESYGGGWNMTDSTWIRSYGSKDVYINTFLRADGGITSGPVASDGAGTIRATSNLRVDGVFTCLQGVCPPVAAMRLTPNFHLNAPNGNAIIVNWDNGSSGGTQNFRVGNGSAGDAFYVEANGATWVGNILTVNGGVVANEGNPNTNVGYSFNGDGAFDTGMFSSGDGQVSLWSNNVEALHIDAGSNPRHVLVKGTMNVDDANADGLQFSIGSGSGEGIGSKRSAGTNQNDLELYTNGSQRMLINNNGQVIIGAGTMPSPIQLFNVNGTASNTSGTWAAYSDRRLKRDITSMTDALATVEKLRPVTFHWKDAKKDAEYGRVRGLIAQEVEEVVPEWVKTDSAGFKMLEPIGMEATLIEAIKEQQKEIADLEARLKQLEPKAPAPRQP